MRCRDAIGVLGDFLASELTRKDVTRLALHLAGCRPCRANLRTCRQAVGAARRACAEQTPDGDVRAFLVETLSRPPGGRLPPVG